MSVLRWTSDCPVLTQACSQAERDQVAPELKAYRLSGRRWIYNKLELVLRQGGGGGAAAAVAQAAASNVQFAAAHQESAVAFLLQLDSGAKVQAHVYLCHADAEPCRSGRTGSASGEEDGDGADQFAWRLVTRQQCCKGCQGPVLRAIQRFGRVGKRQAAKAAAEGEAEAEGGSSGSTGRKDPRFMYLSLDEACTHVGATAFRLVAGIYNRQGSHLLGTAVSPPIRCLANNDAPTGAAHITLEATLPADWEGWGGAAAGKRCSAQPTPRSLKRPGPAEATPQQPPPGLRTPSTSDKLSLLEPPATASRLPALCGASAQWQLPFPPVPSSAPPRLPVARQLSMPVEPPSPLGLGPSGYSGGGGIGGGSGMGAACTGGQAVSEDCSGLDCTGLGAAPADPLWATPPAELAAQLAPSLPFYSASHAAAEREAERQLSLLQQLKCSIAAATQPSASSCGSPLGGRAGGSASSLQIEVQQAPSRFHLPHLPGATYTAPAAAAAATTATAGAGGAGAHSGAGCHAGALGGPAATCHSPLPPPPEPAPGLGGGGLEFSRCCSLDGDLELEAMHSLMSDSQPSGAHVDLAPLLDDVGLMDL